MNGYKSGHVSNFLWISIIISIEKNGDYLYKTQHGAGWQTFHVNIGFFVCLFFVWHVHWIWFWQSQEKKIEINNFVVSMKQTNKKINQIIMLIIMIWWLLKLTKMKWYLYVIKQKKNICQQCSMEIDRSLLFNKLSLSLFL